MDAMKPTMQHSEATSSPKKANTLAESFGYAWQGIARASRERNFRIHCVVAVAAIALCALLKVEPWGWAAVAFAIGLVLASECINTALESVVDLASPEIHPLAKTAKDCAAGAVLVLAIMAVAVGCIVYGTAIFNLL